MNARWGFDVVAPCICFPRRAIRRDDGGFSVEARSLLAEPRLGAVDSPCARSPGVRRRDRRDRCAPERKLFGSAIGCAAAGLGWWLPRRRVSIPALDDSIRAARPLHGLPMVIDALLQMLAVGSGASLGREQAPRMLAAVITDVLVRAGSIPVPQQRMLLGGAGLAAVYDVPAAGALFAVSIVLHTRRLEPILVAVATSSIATVTVWPLTHGASTFTWPPTQFAVPSILLAATLIPAAVMVGGAFTWLTRCAKPSVLPRSWLLVASVGLAGLTVGATSIWLPQLPGNGKSIVLESLNGTSPLLAVLAVIFKPMLTALFIRAGAVGGLITPALSTGTAGGALIAILVNHAGRPCRRRLGGLGGRRRRARCHPERTTVRCGVHRRTDPSTPSGVGCAPPDGDGHAHPGPRRTTMVG